MPNFIYSLINRLAVTDEIARDTISFVRWPRPSYPTCLFIRAKVVIAEKQIAGCLVRDDHTNETVSRDISSTFCEALKKLLPVQSTHPDVNFYFTYEQRIIGENQQSFILRGL